jgi:glycogen debranching enzyme
MMACRIASGYDRYGFAFLPTQYWRGPVWANINWFLMRGLKQLAKRMNLFASSQQLSTSAKTKS